MSIVTPDLSHLTEAAREAALLPNEERVWHIRSDRWIGYAKAQTALSRLDELMLWPKKQRMPNVLMVGPTNNGKSKIVEKFRRDQMVAGCGEFEPGVIPIVVVQVPSEPATGRFYEMLLSSIGAPIRPRAQVAELEQLSLRLCRTVKVKMLIIDELHNVLAGSSRTRRGFLNLLRFLGNELQVPIVGVGTREAYLAIRSDDQLENRFEPLMLPVWEEGEELRSLMASFAAALPLKHPSRIATSGLSKYVLAKTGGTIGEIARLLNAAAIEAVNSGEECINEKTLRLAQYQSPPERRRAFEKG
ncbi:MAG: transposase [Candidatus Melainabacteria bacterium]|nr:MAG: transposase [Candidatus Melainabacteria bacterium]